MRSFDYINDIHLDFWVPVDHNQEKFKNKTVSFTKQLIPDEPSSTLVIGGDLGHYNKQNYWLLEEISKAYTNILIVFGNHDYYLVSNTQIKRYKNNSFNRVDEMKQIVKDLPVTYLEGNLIELDGIKFGGTGMWYDLEYGQQISKKSYDDVYLEWAHNSNDYKKISKMIIKEHFKKEKVNLEKVIRNADVIVTHMGPQWDFSYFKGDQEKHNSYYFFDGAAYQDILKNKVWCFGHIHTTIDKTHMGCRYISHGLGYPDESSFHKIVRISL